jgi:uncharacterized protein involved in outer membrane biogenesis
VQTTLLGIAIAIILALVAALVGPLLIDWGRFRPAIEAEASRLIGTPVRVTGPIEAALLPTPSLTLRGIEAGAPDGGEQVKARSLSIEFYLGELMRGQWRARKLDLTGPEFHLGVTDSGELTSPRIAAGFDPKALSIEHLNIEDGHAVVDDTRSDSRLVLDKLWFNGDVHSLLGPFKGNGAFVVAGKLYGYRIAAGQIDHGALKLHFNIDPVDRPLAVDADGTLSFEKGAPHFEGSLDLARPAGLALPNGKNLISDPWRLAAKITATPASALLRELEFQYGPDERAIKLTGDAKLTFGSKPRLDGVLSATQIDLDRAFATPNTPHLLPLAALRGVSKSLSGALGPAIPARLGVSIDLVTLAGANVRTLRGDLTTDGVTWNLEDFAFRAPGFSQVKLSGRLDMTGKRPAFTGPVSVDSSDPSALAAWLEGSAYPGTNALKPLSAKGDVTLGAEKLAIDRLNAKIDGKAVEGSLAYVWAADNHPARLEANLRAAELNIDVLAALAERAKGATTFEMPRDVTLSVAVDRAWVAGVEARQVNARLRRDAAKLEIEHFSVADFGGAAFDVSGHIDTQAKAPRGRLNMHLDARRPAGIVALLDKFAPGAADSVRRTVERWPAIKLDATLNLEGSGSASVAKVSVEGRSGAIHLSLLGEASGRSDDLARGYWRALAGGKVHVQGQLDADEGSAIINLLDLGNIIAAGFGHPGQLSFAADGPPGGDLQVDGRVLAGGVNAAAKGVLHLGGDVPKADLRLTVAAADVLPLLRAQSGAGDALPLTLIGNLKLTRQALALDDFSGTLAGSSVRGKLTVAFDQPLRIAGQIQADSVDMPGIVAAAIGMRGQGGPTPGAWTWPDQPFAQGLFREIDGRIDFKVGQASLTRTLALRQAQGIASFDRSSVALTDVKGTMADGAASGQLIFSKNNQILSASGRLRLSNADAAALLAGYASITGRLSLQIDAESAGTTAKSLVGSLSGNGTVSLARAELSGLDAKVFTAATQAVDQGLAPETGKLDDLVSTAFKKGRLAIPSAEGVVTIAAGQVRLTDLATQVRGADLTMAGTADLVEGDLNARLTLSSTAAAPNAAVEHPAIFVSLKGPVSAPERSVDVSTLAAWLTMRSVEREAKRLKALEAKQKAEIEAKQKAEAIEAKRKAAALEAKRNAEAIEAKQKAATAKPALAEKPPAAALRALLNAPTGKQAPPLPPPIDIPMVPSVSSQKPARIPAALPTGNATRPVPKPKPLKLVPTPASGALQPDLSASRND